MCKGLHRLLITGGAGFIGAELVRQGAAAGYEISVLDDLSYAGDLLRLSEAEGRFRFHRVDICDSRAVDSVFSEERPEAIIHAAAQTHVDRSIRDASAFIETNIRGTHILLEGALRHGVSRFVHISTDEVYGEIRKGRFSEDSPLRPASPYAASKAAGDLLVGAASRTHGLPAVIVRPCNNYGPWQYPEKLIPLAVLKLLRNEKVPVYGTGENMREWLSVEDCARGIYRALEQGGAGETYNLGSGQECTNLDVVRAVIRTAGGSEDAIEFVKDRPGHDIRYFLDSSKAVGELCWKPRTPFEDGLARTVQWYLDHSTWTLGKWDTIAGLYECPDSP